MDTSSPHHRPRRVSATRPKFNLKEAIAKTLENGDLDRKRKFVETLARETQTDIADVAAAILGLLESQRRAQRDRPIRKPFGDRKAGEFRPERTRAAADPRRRGATSGRPATSGRTARMTRYRIEVGRAHGVHPGQIVGALANESELNGSDIGGIDIQTHFSTVDLPSDMSEAMLHELRKVRVAGQALRLSKWERGGHPGLQEKPKRYQRKRGGKPSWKKPRSRMSARNSE